MARNAGLLGVLVAALAFALSAAAAPGSAASAVEIAHWNGTRWTRVPSPRVSGRLEAVTAVSGRDAWAVGIANGRPLAFHWNGSSWRRTVIPGPVLPGNGELDAVSASSPENVWAVGDWKRRTLIERWNGEQWVRVPSPAGGMAGYLRGVAALSSTNVWAVGSRGNRTLTLHWNGKRWTRVPSPNPGPADGRADALYAVSGDSATDVWAVGLSSFKRTNGAGNRRTLVLRWNGRRWDSVASPNATPLQHGNQLLAVAGTGSAAAWAVGYHGTGRGQSPLVERWNGHTWSLAPTPAWPGSTCCANALKAVVADRSDDVWAAGDFSNVHMAFVPFVDDWNGTSWQRVPLASGISDGFVTGIAAVSPNDVWVVANRPPA